MVKWRFLSLQTFRRMVAWWSIPYDHNIPCGALCCILHTSFSLHFLSVPVVSLWCSTAFPLVLLKCLLCRAGHTALYVSLYWNWAINQLQRITDTDYTLTHSVLTYHRETAQCVIISTTFINDQYFFSINIRAHARRSMCVCTQRALCVREIHYYTPYTILYCHA